MSTDPFAGIIGCSRAAAAMRTFGRRAAAVAAPVLLLGESGTGKGVLARAIHQASARRARPFVAVNCAALPESLFESEFFGHVRGAFTGAQQSHRGLFEQAHGGTLFLDEVAELPPAAQAKLLTVLEDCTVRRVGSEHELRVDVRLIAATVCDLSDYVRTRRFRIDLFHRLSVLCFEIPPLRTRPEDIAELARHLAATIAARYGRSTPELPAATCARLLKHTWPGNVRELSNTVERALLLLHGAVITPNSVAPLPVAAAHMPLGDVVMVRYSFAGTAEEERARIQDALTACRGNKTRAAASLGMSRNTLLNKLRTTNCG